MAVPMTFITDPNPETPYRCTRCRQPVPLSGYRSLYRGTRRPLRCRGCEIATASPGLARYYARTFEGAAAREARRRARLGEEIGARQKAWRAAHQEEIRDYKAGYYAVNAAEVNRRTLAHYYANHDRLREESRQQYAATKGAPGQVASRTAAKLARRAAERTAWLDRVVTAVAAAYDLPAAALTCPADGYAREARMIAVHLCYALRRQRDQLPPAELAATFGLSAQGVRHSHTRLAHRLLLHRTDPDAGFLYETMTETAAALGYRRKPGGFTRGRKGDTRG